MAKPKKANKKHFIIDFDSTFVKVETLDELAKIVLEGNSKKEEILKQIKEITNLGMEGKISFPESLKQRLALFSPNKAEIESMIDFLRGAITASFERNREFFKTFGKDIYIISGGFKDLIVPVVAEFGIPAKNVLANTFEFDAAGSVIGVDQNNPLSQDKGKPKAVAALKLRGEVIVIGDGMTDYHIKEHGAAHSFVAFTENVSRDPVVAKADLVAPNLDVFLHAHKLPASVSYPKTKMKILLLENVHGLAASAFADQGYQVESLPKALPEKELAEKIKGVSILGIRSTTQVSEKVLKNADKLLAIGAFCIGTNQIDLRAAAKRGVAVFNAPYANGRSVVELAIGLIVMLYRRIPIKQAEMHAGTWNKSPAGAREIRGKTLGIVGYGNIGSQLSVVAESLGMKVLFYDLIERPAMSNAVRCDSLKELLNKSDVVTLHVDGRSSNREFFGQDEIEQMKTGAFFLNLSRGFVVDVAAMAKAVKQGSLGGVAIDVFPSEPKESPSRFKTPLQKLSNVILMPHIGGSTIEAQENIALYLSNKLTNYIDTGNTILSVNFPPLQLPMLKDAHRLIHIHRNMPGVLAKINTIMGKHKINIIGQYLGTTDAIGYVITDVNKKYQPKVIEALKRMPETIRLRTLY